MTKINTHLFGEIEVESDKIVTFPKGIPGFEEEREFIFIPIEGTFFEVMQSIKNGNLYFSVIRPFDHFKDYDFQIQEYDLEFLNIKIPEEVLVYNICTIQDDLIKSAANLRAPIIINANEKVGKQIILQNYAIKQPLFLNQPQTLKR